MVSLVLCLLVSAVAAAFWAAKAMRLQRRPQAIAATAAGLACNTAAFCLVMHERNIQTRPASQPPLNVSNPTSANGGLWVEHVMLAGSTFTIVTVDLQQAKLRLFWKRPDGSRFGSFKALSDDLQAKHQRLVFAANAGIFDRSFTPCGLHVEAGVEYVPLNLGDGQGNFYMKPNGVFLVDDSGARIVESSKYGGTNQGMRLATQSGPLLVLDGRINPQFAPASTNRRLRSGVGLSSAQHVHFVISDKAITFHQLASLFRDRLGCREALYLDGVISRFYLPNGGRGNERR